jgi:hypothetical protein
LSKIERGEMEADAKGEADAEGTEAEVEGGNSNAEVAQQPLQRRRMAQGQHSGQHCVSFAWFVGHLNFSISKIFCI